jgi:Iron-dependent Transcriptional regulator
MRLAPPERHLEPMLQAMARHGILKSTRGPLGGYELAREQRRITADEILRAAGTGWAEVLAHDPDELYGNQEPATADVESARQEGKPRLRLLGPDPHAVARFTPRKLMREPNFGRVTSLPERIKIYTSASQTTLADFNNTTDEFGAASRQAGQGRVHCKKKIENQSLQR